MLENVLDEPWGPLTLRAIALPAMLATGMSQRQVAAELGISQPAVSQQVKFAPDLVDLHPDLLHIQTG